MAFDSWSFTLCVHIHVWMFVVGKCEPCFHVLNKIGDKCLVSTVCACAVFLGNLETTVYYSPCSMTVHYWITGVITSTGRNKAVLYAFGEVGQPEMVLKDEQLMAIQHVIMERTCLYVQRILQVAMWSYHLYSCLASTLKRQKQHITSQTRPSHHRSARCSCTLQWHISRNISLYYLLVQLTCLNELYGECNRTVHARTVDTRHSSLIFLSSWGWG